VHWISTKVGRFALMSPVCVPKPNLHPHFTADLQNVQSEEEKARNQSKRLVDHIFD